MKNPNPWREDLADIVWWLATAFVVLALVNGFKRIVPIRDDTPRTPDYVFNHPRTPRG
jgi:hypothetical protein